MALALCVPVLLAVFLLAMGRLEAQLFPPPAPGSPGGDAGDRPADTVPPERTEGPTGP